MSYGNTSGKTLEPVSLEQGYDFISFYFKDMLQVLEYSKKLYTKFNRISFPHIELNRKNFMHAPGDPLHFHTDGDAKDLYPDAYNHFHIVFPGELTQEDWEYLYKHCNDTNLKLRLPKNLPLRRVK